MEYFKKYSKHYSTIIRLGAPLILGQLGIIVTSYADNIMVGNYSTEALASASFVNTVSFLFIMLLMGFSYGLTPLVGALYSQRKDREVGQTVRNSIVASLGYLAILAVPMVLLYAFIDHIGLPHNLMPLIRPYYILVFTSIVPLTVVNMLRQFTDAINDTKVSMYILVGGNLLNIVLNYILIYGKLGAPELGLNGAGIATLISRVLMLVAYLAYVLTKSSYRGYRNGLVNGDTDRQMLRTITATSMPVSLQIGMETAIFSFAAMVAGWLGEACLASTTILNTIGQIGFMIYYSFGAATSIKMANYCGLGEYRKANEAAHAGYVTILVSAAVASAIFFGFGADMSKIFTSDEALIALVTSQIVPLILYQLGDATQIAFANALRGIAHVKPIMTGAFWAYVVVGMPVMYLLAITLRLELTGIYIAYFIALLMAGILFYLAFSRKMRQMLGDAHQGKA